MSSHKVQLLADSSEWGSEHPPTPAVHIKVTWSLIFAIAQALIGVFFFGYFASLFNVPASIVRSNASEYEYINDFYWELANSMFPFGGGVGALLAGPIADRYGRRSFLLLNGLICILGSLCTTFSFWYALLMTGRFISGITSGAATSVTTVYLNEIAPLRLRGVIGTTIQFTISAAILVSILLGKLWLLNSWAWRIGCAIPAVCSLFNLLLSYLTLPESPQWLASRGEIDRAIKALVSLRESDDTVQLELQEFIKGAKKNIADVVGNVGYIAPTTDATDLGATDAYEVNYDNDDISVSAEELGVSKKKIDADHVQGRSESKAILDELDAYSRQSFSYIMQFDGELSLPAALRQYPVLWKVLMLSVCLHTLRQLAGINVVFYYSTQFLESIGVEDAYLGSVLISVGSVVSVGLSTFLIDKKGRRPLLLWSAFGMAASAALLTIMLVEIDAGGSTLFGVGATVCLGMFVVMFAIGLGPVSWLYVAEIAPIEYRGSITSIAQMVNYACNGLVVLTATSLLDALGVYGFLPFGAVCLTGFLAMWRFLPETKQKTVEDILTELR